MTYTMGSELIDMKKIGAMIQSAGIPDTLGGMKTTTIIGWAAVASVGLTVFIVATKISRRKKR